MKIQRSRGGQVQIVRGYSTIFVQDDLGHWHEVSTGKIVSESVVLAALVADALS